MPFSETLPALFAIAVVIGMFALFVTDRFPPEVVAIGGASAMLATGVLPTEAFLGVLSNPAPLTIGAMFVLSGALLRTGALDAFTRFLVERYAERPALMLAGFGAFTMFASAFMNNTPVVLVLIPVALKIAEKIKRSPSKLLIPLSYAGIMGGTCTLLGTSTNLLVDGVAREKGLAPFGLFEIAPLGVAIALVGGLYLAFAAPRLLPDRDSLTNLTSGSRRQRFFTEVVIRNESPLIGRRVLEVGAFTHGGGRVIDVVRHDESLRRELRSVILDEGDRVVLKTPMQEVLSLRDEHDVTLAGSGEKVTERKTVAVEALIGPGCRLAGRLLGRLRIRRRYGVYPIAVHRRGENLGQQLDSVRLQVGDALLLEGAPEDIRRLADDVELLNLSEPADRPLRRKKAPLAVAILVGVVALAAFKVMPIAGLVVIGVAAALLTRSIDADEAFEFIEARILALIVAMLAVGAGLQATGAVRLIVDAVGPVLATLPAPVILLCLYLMTWIMTEMVTNNAVAVVVAPVAIELATTLSLDPRAFAVAVMFAASASFSTPLGYQTNTLVYAPGGYRFTDYMRVGLPLNLIVGALTVLLIPLIWPL